MRGIWEDARRWDGCIGIKVEVLRRVTAENIGMLFQAQWQGERYKDSGGISQFCFLVVKVEVWSIR